MEKKYPKDNQRNSLFSKISNLCKKKVSNVSSAFDSLVIATQQNDGRLSKACSFGSQLLFYEPEESEKWLEKTINFLIDQIQQGKWYSNQKSYYFLFGFNIASCTTQEIQLRILADYALSHELPLNEEQLFDQYRLINLLLSSNNCQRDFYPSGAVCLLSHVLSKQYPLQFKISPKAKSIAIKLFTELRQFKSVTNIYPELTASLLDKKDMDNIHSEANIILEDRINEILSKREYPPMIVQLEPRIEYRAKQRTEEQKLKKQIRREQAALSRDIKKKNEEWILKKYKEGVEKKEIKERENRKVLAMLNEQNTITLNVAAEEPKTQEEIEAEEKAKQEEEEEYDEVTLEPPQAKLPSKKRDFDPDIGYEEDSEEEEYDD